MPTAAPMRCPTWSSPPAVPARATGTWERVSAWLGEMTRPAPSPPTSSGESVAQPVPSPAATWTATIVPTNPAATMTSPISTSTRPSRCTIRPPTGAGDRRADRERRDRQTGFERAVPQADLQVQGEDEEDRGEAGEEQRDQRDAERVRPQPEQIEVDQRLLAAPGVAELPGDERRQQQGGRRDQQPLPGALPLLLLDQRQEQDDDPRAQQCDPDGVVVVPAVLTSVGRQQSPGQRHRHQADRQVEKEDPTPALVGTEGGDQRAAEQGADRGGDADHGAERTERGSSLATAEHLLDQCADLRGEHATGEALDEPGDDEEQAARGQAAGQRGQREQPE